MKSFFYKAIRTPHAMLTAIATLTASCSVALLTHSNPLATITSPEILLYGAADGATIFNHKEFWRILSAQFLHQKQGHMILNVILCWYLGTIIESKLGKAKYLALYFVGGTIGMLASVYFLPDLVSSGASQALMSLCAAILFMKWRKYILPNYLVIATTAIILLQGALDVFVSHSVKPGHTYGFIAGFILSLILIRKKIPTPRLTNTHSK